MYSPILKSNLVKTLYRLKRVYKKPMTKIAEELIRKSLLSIDREPICKTCKGEKNNDCNLCCLAK